MGKFKAIFFDLDGTLLPMDNDIFTKAYFKLICKRLMPLGYGQQELIDAIWAGTGDMVKNDGSRMNEDAFWAKFAKIFGEEKLADKDIFDDFYMTDFVGAKEVCGYDPRAKEVVDYANSEGLKVVLATNPIFPRIATKQRIEWAGLTEDDFVIYTTYENIGFSKPNPKYYQELLDRLSLQAEDCLMVGNDVDEDMIAETIGMNVFLLTDNVINRKDADITKYTRGDFTDLLNYLKANM